MCVLSASKCSRNINSGFQDWVYDHSANIHPVPSSCESFCTAGLGMSQGRCGIQPMNERSTIK
jgi:hypothetical protein